MKKSLILLSIIFLSVLSCTTNEAPVPFKIDGNALIRIKAKAGTQKLLYIKSSSVHLTPLEIVKRATNFRFFNDSLAIGNISIGFAGKDTISAVPAFLRYGTDIINPDGFGKPKLVPDFVYAYDCVVEIFRGNKDIDTIAYIPNSVITNARIQIQNALIAKDTASVYRVFNEAFSFIPITGPEYRELKRQNLQ